MNYIKTLLILLTAIFFISCGSDNEITTAGTTDITQIKIDENNGSAINMYVTDDLTLHSTVYYDDGASQDATQSVSWTNSNYFVANLAQNIVEPKLNYGDIFVTASYKGDLNDTVLIHMIGIEETEINSYDPITTTGLFPLFLTARFEDNITKVVHENITWISDNDSNISTYFNIPQLWIKNTGNTTVTATILDVNVSRVFEIK